MKKDRSNNGQVKKSKLGIAHWTLEKIGNSCESAAEHHRAQDAAAQGHLAPAFNRAMIGRNSPAKGDIYMSASPRT